MALADNIVKYRKRNKLTQEQLAESLMVSRQTVSKWEVGQNLPSIDNLISLSGLLDISLDELITGEPYLHFPFNYGKPRSKAPAIFLSLVILLILIFGAFFNIFVALIVAVLFYLLTIWQSPFDFKTYYDYWTLDKKGISYIKGSGEVYNTFQSLSMPLKALLRVRSTDFVSYKQIKQITLKLQLLGYQPSKTLSLNGGYTASQLDTESFFLKILTKDDVEIYLDLKPFFWHDSIERQMLPTVLAFLKRKDVDFVDEQGIVDLIADRDINLANELYKQRDQINKKNGLP